jgi:DNA-binding NtrC family response regulator
MTTETVLLAEDEAFILDLLEGALSEAGFHLILASDGTQALRELEVGAARLSGVVTDIRLGSGPDGWDVGRRARDLLPQIPVIYISGDSAHDWQANGVRDSIFIPKPFRCAQLVAVLAARLAVPRLQTAGLGTLDYLPDASRTRASQVVLAV